MLRKNFKYFEEEDILQVDKMNIFEKMTCWSYIDKVEEKCFLERKDWIFL